MNCPYKGPYKGPYKTSTKTHHLRRAKDKTKDAPWTKNVALMATVLIQNNSTLKSRISNTNIKKTKKSRFMRGRTFSNHPSLADAGLSDHAGTKSFTLALFVRVIIW